MFRKTLFAAAAMMLSLATLGGAVATLSVNSGAPVA